MEEKLDQILFILTGVKGDINQLQKSQNAMRQEQRSMKEDIAKLQKEQCSIKKELERISNIVTLMEDSHSKKLQVLLDQHSDCVRRHATIDTIFANIDDTFTKHDARIYALEHTD